MKNIGSMSCLRPITLAVGFCAGLLLSTGCALLPGMSARTIQLAANGAANARIVLPNGPSAGVREAGTLLADYLKRSTGAEFAVIEEATLVAGHGEGLSIHVGLTGAARGLALGLESLDADGYVLRFPEAGPAVVICGPTDHGTEFGVYEFLERCVGVRWLFPGELGEHVPSHTALAVQAVDVRDEPVFFSRQMSGLRGDQVLWARRNRMHGRIQFHHHLLKLFPPETYTKTHPEFFPIHGGDRFLPGTNSTHHWQPCYAAPGIVAEAAGNIVRYFDEHPDVPSYSLGANDSSGYCQCEACLARIPGTDNFLGRVDYSDLYYDWANQVIERVLRKYPDKYFGCLAYSEVAAPPRKVSVHSRMIPYMTYDRMKWADREIEKEGQKTTRAWAAVSPTLGWYDYIYGKQYCVPRVWFHKMADYYRFGYENNVRCSYAEAYPSEDWREGPKLYVSLKLLWNTGRDVDGLLHEWYSCAVGEKAAPALARYFRFWEEFWAGPVRETEWFQSARQRQYLNFKGTGYLAALVPGDLECCEALLKEVLTRAGTDRQEARARKFLDNFRTFTEPLADEIVRRQQEKATRDVALEKVERLAAIRALEGEGLARAVGTYRTWLEAQPVCPMTGAIKLVTGLLAQQAGQTGAWQQALAASPWGNTSAGWLRECLASLDPTTVLTNDALPVLRTSQAPAVDGKLDEACWQNADKIGGFVDYLSNTVLEQPTFVAAACDEKHLYLAYVCLQRNTSSLVAECRKHDGPVWRDDSVEFFVTPPASSETFYQIIVNAAGVTYDAGGSKQTKWNPALRAQVVKGDRFWTVEMAIPFAAFPGAAPRPGEEWRVNFTRARLHFGTQTIGVWRFADGKNNDITRFGRMIFR